MIQNKIEFQCENNSGMEVFKFFVFTACFMEICDACETIVFPETLNGCSFSDLSLVNPKTGFVVTGVNCGLEVYKSTFYDQPFVFFSGARDNAKYTLIMVDKDNPACNVGDMYLHWLVTEIDGQSLKYGLGVYGGKTVAGERNLPKNNSLKFLLKILTNYLKQLLHHLQFLKQGFLKCRILEFLEFSGIFGIFLEFFGIILKFQKV